MLRCDSRMVQCDSRGLGNSRIRIDLTTYCTSDCHAPAGPLAPVESGMILSLPSRFAGGSDGRHGDRVLRRCPIKKNGAVVLQRVGERQTVSIRKLADDRAEQVKFRRFLANEAVTVEEMVAHRAMLVAATAAGRHVLAIQDTS